VYINLLGQKEPTLNFKNEENIKTLITSNNKNQYYKKIIKPSEEEIKLHKEYLKNNLKKNFFN
jgi:DNA polymerase-3 subunit epsilon